MSSENDLFADDFGDIYSQLTSDSVGVATPSDPELESPAPPPSRPETSAEREFSTDEGDDFGRILEEEYGDEAPARPAGKKPKPGKSDFDLADAPACPQCGSTESWGQARWCPECGYYPEMGDCVDTGESPIKEVREINNWWEVLPMWGWILIGGIVGMIVSSLAVRVLMPAGSTKLWLAICVLVAGFLTFVIAHFRAYITAVHKNDKLAPIDFFINPMTVWNDTFQNQLPERASRVWAGAWGLTAMLCGGVFMGGFTLDDIFKHDWADADANAKLKMAIVDQKKKNDGEEETLEDAVGKMIGIENGPLSIDERPRLECVIVGFTKTDDGEPESLLLASLWRNSLTYIGKLDISSLPEDAKDRILEALSEIKTSSPLVKFPMEATAVDARLMVKVHYLDRKKSGRITEIGFDKMLADLEE